MSGYLDSTGGADCGGGGRSATKKQNRPEYVRGRGRAGCRKSKKETDRQMEEKREREREEEILLFIVKDILSKFLLFVWLVF